MKLGSKIIVSFVCISMLIVTLGVVSQWYSNSIQTQLNSNNEETTRLVGLTANLERSLYQSLIFITAIKEADKTAVGEITLREPTVIMLTDQFNNELVLINNLLDNVRTLLTQIEVADSNQDSEILYELEEKVGFYTSLSKDWVEIAKDDSGQANELFNTSISPYFRNNLIPVVDELREQVIAKRNQENEDLTDNLDQANYVIALVSVICVILSIMIAVYVYRSIARPLKKLNESATRIGGGNLDERIEVKSEDELGKLAEAFNEMAVNLKKRTLARDYLDNIIETIRETLIVTDEKGIIVGINKAGLEMLHFRKEEIIGLPVRDFYDTDVSGNNLEGKREKDTVFEFFFITKRKNRIPVLFSESDLINSEGEKVGTVCVATDISERKAAAEKMQESLKEKEVLLSEIHHRVKNNLAVISGILHLQVFQTENEEVAKAIRDSQARIQSISLVHEMLYQSDTLAFIDYKIYVNDLMQAISSTHISGERTIELISKVENVSLNVNQAIPCSLLLNEVIVNSFKHAFKNREEGEIAVYMKEEKGMLNLVVEDNGIGIKDEDILKSGSLGGTLIKTLVSQLNGDFKISARKDGIGTRVEVNFPKK